MFPRSKKKLCRGIELCLFTAWIKEKKTCSLCSRNMLWLSWAYCVYATVALKRHLYACLGKTQSCLWRRADFIPESSFFTFLAEDRKKTDES